MSMKDEYPEGASGERWAEFCDFVIKMKENGTDLAALISKNMPEMAGKNYSNPTSFTNKEVWAILEWLEK